MNDIIGRKLKDLPYVDGGARGSDTYVEKNGQPYRARVGEAGGLAVLGNDGKVPGESLPAADPIRSDLSSSAANKGAALVQYDADETVKARLDTLGNLRADLADEDPGYGPDLVRVSASQTLRQWIAALATSVGSSLVGFLQAGTGAVLRTIQSKLRDRVSVKDFGAVGNVTTDDTAAFNAAFAAADEVYVPPGTYNVRELIIPANKRLVGAAKRASVLRTTIAATFMVRLMANSEIVNMGINGNRLADHGVEFGGDYCKAIETHSQYCVAGFYNIDKDVWEMLGTSTDNCTYSFYNAERGINVVIDRHTSRGLDTYGLYWTYAVQQPQGMRIKNMLLIGNQYGVYFAKDAFNVEINGIIDLCSNVGIYLEEVTEYTSTDYIIDCPYISAANYGIRVKPGHHHIIIQNCSIANGYDGIHFDATTTKRSTGLTIRDVLIGNCSHNAISLDSVQSAHIVDCMFAAAGGTQAIGTAGTYTAGTNPRINVDNCMFYNGDGSVSAFNTRVRNSVGVVRSNYGTAAVPSGGTSVVVNHSLTKTPTNVWVTPHGNLGNYWVSNFTATQFTLNIGTTAGVAVPFSWEARAD